jgi:hypothetical protein
MTMIMIKPFLLSTLWPQWKSLILFIIHLTHL